MRYFCSYLILANSMTRASSRYSYFTHSIKLLLYSRIFELSKAGNKRKITWIVRNKKFGLYEIPFRLLRSEHRGLRDSDFILRDARKIRRFCSVLPLDWIHSPGTDAAVEKGNETSPALLYLSSSLCRNAPSSHREVRPPGRTEKRASRRD